jgi:hypothetical protein
MLSSELSPEEILSENEKKRIIKCFDEIFQLEGFEFFHVYGWILNADEDEEGKLKPTELNPITDACAQDIDNNFLTVNDFKKMKATAQNSKDDFYKIIRKYLFDLNKIGLLRKDNNFNYLIKKDYPEKGKDFTVRVCMNMLLMWSYFFNDFDMLLKITNPLNKRGELITINKVIDTYSIPNSSFVNDFYLYLFCFTLPANFKALQNSNDIYEITETKSQAIKARLENYDKHHNITVTPKLIRSNSDTDIGIVTYEKSKKGNPKKNIIIEKRMKNEEGNFLNSAAANKYRKLYFYLLQQLVEQGCNNLIIHMSDIIAKGIYADEKEAYFSFCRFLDFQDSFTVLQYNDIRVGTTIFKYQKNEDGSPATPSKLPKHPYKNIWVDDLIAGALLSSKPDSHTRRYFTTFPNFAYSLDSTAFDIVVHICFTMRQNGKYLDDMGFYTIKLQTLAEKLMLPTISEAEEMTRKERTDAKNKLLNAIKAVNDSSKGMIEIELSGPTNRMNYCELLKSIDAKIRLDEKMSQKSIDASRKQIEKQSRSRSSKSKKKTKK